jgi:CheY-specific phosphatase CheX
MMPIALVTSEDIESISSDFWSSMVDVSLRRVPSPAASANDDEAIVGCIEIRGAWSGVIEVKASRMLAQATASSLLEKRASEVTLEECFDAVQEATNIIAGSIKRLLPTICKLGLPAMDGSSTSFCAQQCSNVLEVYFASRCGELAITVGSRERPSDTTIGRFI